MNTSTQISTLSQRARIKGRILYYSFLLQLVNTFFLFIHTKNNKQISIFYLLVTAIGAFACYSFRPSNIQSLIDKWSAKGAFPIKKGSPKSLRMIIAGGFVVNIVRFISRPDTITINLLIMALLSIPMIVFIFDDEIMNFIFTEIKI